MADDVFVHESAYLDAGAIVGTGTSIWHFCHVMSGARIGCDCSLGQNVNVAQEVIIGDRVKIQNNVSIYAGTIVEDDVFLGPSCVLTNISNPRSEVSRRALYEPTVLRRGATVGANATIVCGVEIGRFAFIAAGAVVTRSIPDYGFVMGNPGRRVGWMSRHGHRLPSPDGEGVMACPESGLRYRESPDGTVTCLDIDETGELPPDMRTGKADYPSFRDQRGDTP